MKLRLATLDVMSQAFRHLETRIPPAKWTKTPSGFGMRFREQLPSQAVLQKLARYISGIHSVGLLLSAGYLQEQAIIQRTLDEINEDIFYICIAEINKDYTNKHDKFLAAFWEEEFDCPDPIKSKSSRPIILRKHIRAYVNRASGESDVSFADAVGRTIHSAYSGFVHAASPQVMDMYGRSPPRFFLSGLIGTPMIEAAWEDAWNYYYRGVMAVAVATLAFGDPKQTKKLYLYLQNLDNEKNDR